MNYNYLKKLEYDKILKILSSFCNTHIGKKLALNLSVSNDLCTVEKSLSETEEAVNLIYKNSSPHFLEIADITIYIKSLESSKPLSIKAILELANIFKLSQDLKDYFSKDYINSDDFIILNSLFKDLYSNKSILDKVYHCIIDENTLDDKASQNLQKIRNKKRKFEQDIKDKLNSMIHSSNFSKYIQENIITIRNDRFVIPIKEEYRNQIKGFVHDISNAGSTIFIEPISIFELNNSLNQLKLDEEIEIEKILYNLSSLFFPYINELEKDTEIIGKLDFIFAKAKYSKSIKGITPKINSDKKIQLNNARHPLIEPDKVVPISLTLGDKFSNLLITGPNTGGKTVTLKTVGLLTCMACSGLNIPADESSSIYVFKNIFADIGDDQSIADSLSTFSSHMTNIVEITKQANKDSLILVDELGSGTDPLEGAHLAIAILEYFKNIGALTIATTHYQELKKYALTTDGFENASVEFDINTLSPTYKLLVGIPGKSNAFEISQKLGLNNKIIYRAKSLMSKKDFDFEELLKNIYDDKSSIENEKIEISKELEKISKLRQHLEREKESKQEKEKEILNNAKIQARNILLEAKEEASNIIKKMYNSSSSKELENYRNLLNDKIKDIKTINNDTSSNNNQISISQIVPNTKVFITSLNQEGVILSNISKSNEVQVQIGNIKTNVNIKYLQKISSKQENKSNISHSYYTNISKSKNISTEINVIGMNIEEAVFVIDKFLDDCSLAKLETIRIIHGKGTGKLKNGIHQFLRKNAHVKDFRIGTYGEGEMGVTVVHLK